MNALRFETTIPADHVLRVELPNTIACGPAEVILLFPDAAAPVRRRQAGSAKGKIRLGADFDEPLADFAEYAK